MITKETHLLCVRSLYNKNVSIYTANSEAVVCVREKLTKPVLAVLYVKHSCF